MWQEIPELVSTAEALTLEDTPMEMGRSNLVNQHTQSTAPVERPKRKNRRGKRGKKKPKLDKEMLGLELAPTTTSTGAVETIEIASPSSASFLTDSVFHRILNAANCAISPFSPLTALSASSMVVQTEAQARYAQPEASMAAVPLVAHTESEVPSVSTSGTKGGGAYFQAPWKMRRKLKKVQHASMGKKSRGRAEKSAVDPVALAIRDGLV